MTTGTGGNNRPSLRSGLRLIRALPGEPAFATVVGAMRKHRRQLKRLHRRARTTRLRRPQREPLVSRPLHVHRIPASRFVTTAIRPSQARRDEPTIQLIPPSEKRKYFSVGVLTGILRRRPWSLDGQNQLRWSVPYPSCRRDERDASRRWRDRTCPEGKRA